MTNNEPGSPKTAPAWRPLDAHQRRVLGVLIEKAKTTPGGYPMSVNAIVTGANQRNNREPIMVLDESDVEQALHGLGALKVVSEIDWLGRVSKFKHHAYEWLGVSKAELAVLAELLLRGEQAMGELRGRAARMEPIADLSALKPIVDGLIERRLMVALTPPGRGQLVSHNLYLPPELADLRSRRHGHTPRAASPMGGDAGPRDPVATTAFTGDPHRSPPRSTPERAGIDVTAGGAADVTTGGTAEVAARLGSEVAELRSELAHLRERVAALESKLTDSQG